MSKRQTYTIAGELFTTKAALQARIRGILHRMPDGQLLSLPDFEFMLDVLKRHADYEQKAGAGVAGILVRPNPVYTNTRTFYVVRVDGTTTDFSYLESLKETPHAKRFYNACRVAIEPDIQAFKASAFAGGGLVVCPYTGEKLAFVGAHVDHKAPATFQALVDRFIELNAIDLAGVAIKGKAQDNTYQDTFDDKDMERAWVAFHNTNAVLQVVSRTANLSILRKGGAQ